MSSKSIPSDLSTFESLIKVVATLRGPDGCPWDREQTHETLVKYSIEEVCEYVEAVESKNPALMTEELGDVLFQVILNSQIAKEQGQFEIKNVIETLNKKMISRHPHVFGDVKVDSAEEVVSNWEQIKKKEKAGVKKLGFSLPRELPSLQTAQKIGKKTEKTGFDWSTPSEVMAKVDEEVLEMKTEFATLSRDPSAKEKFSNELGDVLFSLAQLARHLGLDAEQSLRTANARFEKRYFTMIADVGDEETFKNLSNPEKEALWAKAKSLTEKK